MKQRYILAPQMSAYDALKPFLHPQLGASCPASWESSTVSTDRHGYRHTLVKGERVGADAWQNRDARHLMVGSSFVFGVGATRDATTLPSVLSQRHNAAFLNCGVRAGNSFQELTNAYPFISEASSVLVCSGANNLIAALQSDSQNQLFGPFFFESAFEPLTHVPLHELSRSGGIRRTRKISNHATHARQSRTVSQSQLEARAQQALDRQVRDAVSLKRLSRPSAGFVFVVQPFALEEPTNSSELQLFELHDRLQGPSWALIKDFAHYTWRSYRTELSRRLSDVGIRVIDADAWEPVGWSFVDRVHLTDSGYAQFANYLEVNA